MNKDRRENPPDAAETRRLIRQILDGSPPSSASPHPLPGQMGAGHAGAGRNRAAELSETHEQPGAAKTMKPAHSHAPRGARALDDRRRPRVLDAKDVPAWVDVPKTLRRLADRQPARNEREAMETVALAIASVRAHVGRPIDDGEALAIIADHFVAVHEGRKSALAEPPSSEEGGGTVT